MEGYAALGSTNERAQSWAREGACEGSTVVTDHQTNGRGRHGRRWHAQAGQSLTFSLVLRPDRTGGSTPGVRPSEEVNAHPALPAQRWGLVALAGGLAVCDALDDVAAPPSPRIKWPNDVLLNGQKCCGILVETSSTGPAPGPLVLGIGLNVNQRDFPAMPAGRTPPTSVALAVGRPIERAPLLALLLQRIEARYESLFEDAGHAVRTACEKRLAALGERVTVQSTTSGETVDGTFLGLAADGAMRLQTAQGERTLHAGDVTTKSSR